MRSLVVMLAAMLTGMSVFAAEPLMWVDGAKTDDADYHVAFRGTVELPADATVEVHMLGASWYVLWVDGTYVTEGPPRFPIAYPEYQTVEIPLAAGKHVLAFQVHHEGVSTRILDNVAPFLYCRAYNGEQEIPIQWKCKRLDGYAQKVRRINAQLGWVEWCDTRQLPAVWQSVEFDDSAWAAPAPTEVKLGEMKPLSADHVNAIVTTVKPVAEGPVAETYGYERDDISARFFLRDLECKALPPDGVWRRYDLGRVRLGRPRFVMDLPAGSVVEFAYSETLEHGRVSPWITLSASDSCNLDHFVARGGEQEFFPLAPKGGRFMEVHVIAPPEKTRFVKEEYMERTYYGDPQGAFRTNDELLNTIWNVGVETYRGCSEDALIDNPTRERGQWAGDVVSVGMDIAGVAYDDLRLCRRALMQCAQSARKDGLVAGLCPGGAAYMSTYAAQWVTACLHYWQLTGDTGLLRELHDFAARNIAAFEKFRTADGVSDDVGWAFVDWGYVRNEGPTDMGVNMHYLAAVRDMMGWCKAIDCKDYADYEKIESEVLALVRGWIEKNSRNGRPDCETIGYHRTVLAMRLGLIEPEHETEAIEYIKRHILRCFPNDPSAPRLSNPNMNQERLITPYFAHYAFPLLIERGEMNFVLDQYRKCWGWALGDGRTTWLEVFDTRWSHCHQWAGCPTWQLSRYSLGLTPRFDVKTGLYRFNLIPGDLEEASGKIPGPEGGTIDVRWRRVEKDRIHCEIKAGQPVTLELPTPDGLRTMQVAGTATLALHKSGGRWVFTTAAIKLPEKTVEGMDAVGPPVSQLEFDAHGSVALAQYPGDSHVAVLTAPRNDRSGGSGAPPAPGSADLPLKVGPAPRIESSWDDMLAGVESADDWPARREDIRRRYLDLLRDQHKPEKPPLEVQVHESVDVEGIYTRHLISYNVEADERAHAFLAIPTGLTSPAPAVVALHGTFEHGKEQAAGLVDNPDKAYLDHLARRGYVVIAPDHFVAGHRVPPEGPYVTKRFYEKHPEWTAVGKFTYEHSIAIDVLCSRPEVDAKRIGVLGHSLGGHGTIFLAAYDKRVKAAACNCGGSFFRHNEKVTEWSRDRWYVYFKHLRPGLLAGELPPIDFHEIIALIAPRAFLDLSALNDGNGATQRQRALMNLKVMDVYELAGAPENFAFYVHGQGHSVPHDSRALMYAWMDKHLKPADAIKTRLAKGA